MLKFLGIAMSVDFFGTINTCFILFSLIGVFSQLRTIWRRKHANEQHPTHILSLKMFSISFLAYYSFFVYGMSIQPFNHYIVWPRLCASILVAFILYELWKDRKTISTLPSPNSARATASRYTRRKTPTTRCGSSALPS